MIRWLSAVAVIIHLSQIAFAQPAPRDRGANTLYDPIELITADGDAIRGLYLSVGLDSIYVLERGMTRSIAIREVRRCSMHFDRERTAGDFLVGVFGVGYLAGLQFMPDIGFKAPGYLELHYGRMLGTAAVSVLGGYASWTLAGFRTGNESMSLNEQGSDFEDDRAALVQFIHDRREPRFHISVEGGQVDTRKTEIPRGITFVERPHPGQPDQPVVTSFALLRKVQLTYSLSPPWEVGFAWVNMGEPEFLVHNSEYYSESFSSGSILCAVVDVRPTFSFLPEWILPHAGVAVGSAHVHLDYSRSPNSQPGVSTSVHANGFAYNVFIGFDLAYGRLGSVGFIVDHAAVPSVRFPAEPGMGLASRKLANTCIGFSLGFHL